MRLRAPSRPRRHLIPVLTGILASALAIATIVGATLGTTAARAAGSAGSAFIRINQLGYATTATQRAYLMATASEAGAMFTVRNASGTTAASGTVGASLGSWSSGYPDVYALDFDGVSTPGTYTIAVSGPIAATSPSFPVNTASALYTAAMANALSFYQNERNGSGYIPLGAAHRAWTPQRLQRDDLSDAQHEQQRALL